MNLTSLAALIPLHLDEIPRREQRAWIDGREPVMLQATLRNTCVVRPLPDLGRGTARVVPIPTVFVEAETLAWVRHDPEAWITTLGADSKLVRRVMPTARQRAARGRENARNNLRKARR